MTFHLDLRGAQPSLRRPELLQHPQIPGPLAGMNPRSILGDDWWKGTRRGAYARNAYHCHACAGAPDDDPYRDKLDAHECYIIDWEHANATYTETVALCWSCHNFIHCGRLRALVEEGHEDKDKLEHVLRRGMVLLAAGGLLPYWRTYVLSKEYLDGTMYYEAIAGARKKYPSGVISTYDMVRVPAHKWTVTINEIVYRRDTNGKIVTKV